MEAMNPSALSAYAGLCGWTLARAHARSGDAAAIASYLGTGDKFDRAMSAFAETYADQNERDYARSKLPSTPGRSLPRAREVTGFGAERSSPSTMSEPHRGFNGRRWTRLVMTWTNLLAPWRLVQGDQRRRFSPKRIAEVCDVRGSPHLVLA